MDTASTYHRAPLHVSPFTPGTTHFAPLDHRSLAQAGGIGVDMHFHTRYSDGTARVRSALRRAERLGIGLAITDHNEVRGALEARHLSDGKVFLIPAIEVNAAEGCDLLVYFASYRDLVRYYEEHVAPYRGVNPIGRLRRGLLALAEGAVAHGGFVVAAHPFGLFGSKNLHAWTLLHGRALLEHVGAIEVNNASMSSVSNAAAAWWASTLHIGRSGGSDGHTLRELGRVVTWAPIGARTPAEFLEAVSDGRCAVVGERAGFLTRVQATLQLFRRHALYTIPGLRSLVHSIDRRAKFARTAILASHPWAQQLLEERDGRDVSRTTKSAPQPAGAGTGR